jgi:hypothetical protein
LVWWTHFADSQKQLNPLGQYITSTALKDFNFGTLEQRCSADTWLTILSRANALFGKQVILGAFLGLSLSRRRWGEALVFVFLYLSAPLIFTNLHYVHDYYAFGNNIFLVAAVGVCLAALMERGGWYGKAVPPGILLILLMGGRFYFQHYYPQQHNSKVDILEVCEAIQRLTQIDDMIVVLGCDWSSELPYYSRRRALMVPNWAPSSFSISAYLAKLKEYRVGALIVHHSTNDPLDQDWVGETDKETGFSLKSKIRVDKQTQDGDRSYEYYEIFVGE